MNRLFAVASVFALGLGAAHAGTIVQIGQTSGSNNYGLTNSYITTAPNNGTKTNFTEIGYTTTLFHSAAVTAPPMATSTTAVSVNDPTNGGVTFALLGDTGSSENAWENNSVSSNTLTIPINELNVDSLWTMINDTYGDTTNTADAASVTVTFYFNSTDTMTGASTETVKLVNGQEIRASVLCTYPGTGCPSTQPTTFNSPSNTFTTAGSTLSGTGGLSSLTVTTGSIQYPNGTTYNPSYTSGIISGQDAGSTGSVALDDQQFSFGQQFANQYLVAMTITDVASPTDTLDHIALSAVSVDVFAPEPSAFVLLFAGLAFLGLARKRFSKAV
jgi:hypothetical protein